MHTDLVFKFEFLKLKIEEDSPPHPPFSTHPHPTTNVLVTPIYRYLYYKYI